MPQLQIPQFTYPNYGQAVEQGNRNALMQMRMQMAAEDRPMERQQSQNKLRQQQMDMMIQGFKYVKAKAPLVTDESTYQAFRRDLIENRLLAPDEIPEQYDPAYINRISGIASQQLEQFGDFEPVPGLPHHVGQRSTKTRKYANIQDTRDKPTNEPKVTKSDRIMALAGKIANSQATPQEREEYFLLVNADPITRAVMESMTGRGVSPPPASNAPQQPMQEQMPAGQPTVMQDKTGKRWLVDPQTRQVLGPAE